MIKATQVNETIVVRGERQQHGFTYENDVIYRYGLEKSSGYTAKFDAIKDETMVSIKTKINGGSVEMADYFRNATVTENFILIVGFHTGPERKIVKELTMEIEHGYWMSNFSPQWEQPIRDLLASVDNTKETDALWKRNRLALQSSYKNWAKESGSIIKLNPKRDHKNQLRMQCSISYKNILMLNNMFAITL